MYNSQCVLSCPKNFVLNQLTNTCQAGEVQVVSFSFLFLFTSVFLGSVIILTSIIVTRNQNKTTDIIYAVVTSVEFVNRLCLMGNLFLKQQVTGVFPLSVCFMNIVATSSLGLFFNMLFMTPIYAHSPHFRTLWKTQYKKTFILMEWLSYLTGPNAMRLLSSRFLSLQAMSSDLNQHRYFSVPLNLLANYTLIFSAT